jgi:hypothetical protein
MWIAYTTKKVDFIIEYLWKYRAMCKKALTHGPVAQMESFDDKIVLLSPPFPIPEWTFV